MNQPKEDYQSIVERSREKTRLRVQRWREANRDRAKSQNRRAYENHKKTNPEKVAARNAIAMALRYKMMEKKPCAICGASKTEAHHPDYSKPLDVIWLCRKHHGALHKGTK